MKEKICVIMPAYNEAKQIGDALQGVIEWVKKGARTTKKKINAKTKTTLKSEKDKLLI